MTMRFFAVFFLSLCSLVGNTAFGDLFVYESFDYPFGVPLSQASNTGIGFSTNWAPGGRGTLLSGWRVQNDSLSFGSLSTNGNSVTTPFADTNVFGINRQTSQAFAGVNDGQTTYMSFLIQQTGAGGQFGGFGGIYVGDNVSENDPKLFIGRSGNSANWSMETLGGTGVVQSDSAIAFNQTALLVVKMESQTNGRLNDRFTLYVNPTSQTEPLNGFVKTDLNIGIANRITLFNAGAFSIDEIRIGSTFADVIAVPEPSSILLVLVSTSLGLVRRTRRRHT